MSTDVVNLREPVSEALRQKVSEDAGWRCHYCNRVGQTFIGPDERPWNIDHKLAVSRGGKSDEANLALACERCNVSKRNRDYAEFVAYARDAYWVDDVDALPDAVLDMLANAWYRIGKGAHNRTYTTSLVFDEVPDPRWRGTAIHVIEIESTFPDGSAIGDRRALALGASGTSSNDEAALFRFIELAYRHMPALLDAAQNGRAS